MGSLRGPLPCNGIAYQKVLLMFSALGHPLPVGSYLKIIESEISKILSKKCGKKEKANVTGPTI